jgi:hypothetical protein
MIQVHHATFTFFFRCRSDEKVFSDLNFGRPEFFPYLVTLVLCKNVATLYDYNFSFFIVSFEKRPRPSIELARFSTLYEK